MTPIIDLMASASGILIYTAALLLILLQFAVLLYSAQNRRNNRNFISAVLLNTIGTIVFGLILYAASAHRNLDPGEVLEPGGLAYRIFYVPWGVYTAGELAAALMLFWQIRHLVRYNRTHLTRNAVKETLDWLPIGVCIGDAEGTVVLSNIKMVELSRKITERYLWNSIEFWQAITQNGIPQDQGFLLETKDGHAYLFTKTPLTMRKSDTALHYEQITASDMTDAYRITKELSAKNQHLKDVQFRMKAVAARERSLIAAREVVKARTAVHNQMGGVLLSGKYYLDHPEGFDETELLHLTEYNNYFLLREAERQEKPADLMQDVLKMAKRIGVTVEIEGKMPERTAARDLIAQAIEQCAANTVRHAGGDRLTVSITESETHFTAALRNNGKPPEKPIIETGGLVYLRHAVEAEGGSMAVAHAPEFLLTVSVPKKT